MHKMHETEYFVIGKFPDSEKILGIGPKKRTDSTILLHAEEAIDDERTNFYFIAELLVNSKDLRGKIVFERDEEGEPFRSIRTLKDFLIDKFSISYMRDTSKPAITTSG